MYHDKEAVSASLSLMWPARLQNGFAVFVVCSYYSRGYLESPGSRFQVTLTISTYTALGLNTLQQRSHFSVNENYCKLLKRIFSIVRYKQSPVYEMKNIRILSMKETHSSNLYLASFIASTIFSELSFS